MKWLLTLYHFLGSLYFALILIASVALFVIAGTIIESKTQSHLYAAHFTYSNPLFGLLLWGFFINIFFSATRRWPFEIKHVPFLTTHFGLLMILAGALSKYYFGLQGSMSATEGSGAQEIFLANSYSIQLHKHGELSPKRFPLKKGMDGKFNSLIDNSDGLKLHLVEFVPHSSEYMATWIKGDYAYIAGLNPLKVHQLENATDIPISGKVRFDQDSSTIWSLFALRSSDIHSLIDKLYENEARIRFTDRISNEILAEVPFAEALHSPVPIQKYGEARARINLNFSPIDGFQEPLLEVAFSNPDRIFLVDVPLDGLEALLNKNHSTPFFGDFPIAVDIVRSPLLAIIEDEHEDVYLIAIYPQGGIWSKSFRKNDFDSFISYDDGFGGYAVQTTLPIKNSFSDRKERESKMQDQLSAQLKNAETKNLEISPPLEILKEACAQTKSDFGNTCLSFLTHWNNTHHWLYPENVPLPSDLKPVFASLSWHNPHEIQACQWAADIFPSLDPLLSKNIDLIDILREKKWPLISLLEKHRNGEGPCTPDETFILLTLLTQQLFAAAEVLPEKEASAENSAEQQAVLLSAMMRAFNIHLSTIKPILNAEEMEPSVGIQLETSVLPIQKSLPPRKKLEDNFSKITLQASKGKTAQYISLSYDRYGQGLKWPLLNGEYLIRFQPQFVEIPYRIRLRNARQINYSNSQQPYSFESDLIITDRRTGQSVEKTISMNNVHETWDGYRFYLASIAPSDESTVKRIQIVVNYDPTKYWLTYPGAFILSFGMILLLWMKPYGKKKN